MPSTESEGVLNMWYSFDFGPAHIVSVDTETDFDKSPEGSADAPCDSASPKIPGVGMLCQDHLYKAGEFAPEEGYLQWLEADLRRANASRSAERPWVVAMGHRTWLVRDGLAPKGKDDAAVEAVHRALFEKYQVDLYICGHKHAYMRFLPAKGQAATPLVVTGAAGNDEGLAAKEYPDTQVTNAEWDYMQRSSMYQVGTIDVSRTQLTWKAIDSSTGKVFDSFTLTKGAVA